MKKQLTAIAALLLVSSMSFAAEYNARTIKFAATSPKGTPPAIGMEMFAEKVAERSGGKIKVRTFPNGVLGGDVQVLSSLQGGVIEMMTWNAGLMLNHVTDFGILDFPFLYTDTAKVDAMLDGQFVQFDLHLRRVERPRPVRAPFPLGHRSAAFQPFHQFHRKSGKDRPLERFVVGTVPDIDQ